MGFGVGSEAFSLKLLRSVSLCSWSVLVETISLFHPRLLFCCISFLPRLDHREIERPASPPSDVAGSGDPDEVDGKGSWDRSPAHRPAAGGLSGDQQGSRHTSNSDDDCGRAEQAADKTNAPERPSFCDPGGASSSSAYGAEEDDDLGFGADSSDGEDDAGIFGRDYGAGDRGIYRGEYSDDDHGSEAGGSEDGEGGSVGGSVENLSLSPDSSEWRPLKGAGFVAPSSRQDQSGDWFSQSSQPEKVRSNTSQVSECMDSCATTLFDSEQYIRMEPQMDRWEKLGASIPFTQALLVTMQSFRCTPCATRGKPFLWGV